MTNLDFRNDSLDRIAQNLLVGDDLINLGVELSDVDFLAPIFLSDVSADAEVDEIKIYEVLTDFLFSDAAIHNAGEADDSGDTIWSKPVEGMHDKSHVRLTFWSEDAGGSEARIINQ